MRRWLMRQLVPNPVMRVLLTLLLITGIGRRFVRRVLLRRLKRASNQFLEAFVGSSAARSLRRSGLYELVFQRFLKPMVDLAIGVAAPR